MLVQVEDHLQYKIEQASHEVCIEKIPRSSILAPQIPLVRGVMG